jgi:hypothetical protein
MTVILKDSTCEGERVSRLSENTTSVWRHPAGEHLRYVHTGAIDSATGYRIFVHSPLRRRKSRLLTVTGDR